MQKRRIIIGDYDTAEHGWTLTGWSFSAAEQKTKLIEKQAGDGSWDLSTILTDGIARYYDRELIATFECSEGNRESREALIRQMINKLDGVRVDITLPDDDLYYISGRVHVERKYSDLAHASVTVIAKCDPWKYSKTETTHRINLFRTKRTVELVNEGRRAVVPNLKVTEGPAVIAYGEKTHTVFEGENKQWADLLLTPGTHTITVHGWGTLEISYREAVLE